MKSKFSINIKSFTITTLAVFIVVIQLGCKKLVSVDPPNTSTTSKNAFSTDATAAAVLTGIYTNMSSNDYRFVTGYNSISIKSGLSADELTLFGGSNSGIAELARFYINSLTTSDQDPWTPIYSCILPLNTAIEKLQNANSLTPSVRTQLIGEAKFLRAFCYFYLVNLYGDVPLAIQSDYRANSSLSRASQTLVYQQIISDLKDAQGNLSDKFLDATLLKETPERVRPSKWAATALLARVYLYTKDWANAETQATTLINNSGVFQLSSLDNAFLKAGLGNKEAIWQLQPVMSGWNTEDARVFILDAPPSNFGKPVYLSPSLLNSFESNDQRRTKWIKDTVFSSVNYSYPTKYKIGNSGMPVTEYLMIFRLSEQYLIRAEARAQLNTNISGAQSDLNAVRTRAGLPNTTAATQQALLTAILKERRVELFTEWGHRWLDLKRTTNVNTVMSIEALQKSTTWNSNWALYPIPIYDLQQNPNLTQNVGY